MSVDSPYPETIITDVLMPDVQQYVDTYDAAHMNDVRAAIRDITATLGINPQGTLATLVSRLAVSLNTNGTIKRPSNTLTVSPQNGDYSTIQSALNSITDASVNNRWSVIVFPGVYAENVIMKPYINLVGYDPALFTYYQTYDPVAKIIPVSGVAITLPESENEDKYFISNILAKSPDNNCLITNSPCALYITNSKFFNSSANHNLILIKESFTLFSRTSVFYPTSNAKHTFELNSSGSYCSCELRFTDCFLNGAIRMIANFSNLTVNMNRSHNIFGIYSSTPATYIDMFFSSINGASNNPIAISSGDEASCCIYYSLLRSNSHLAPIVRLSGTPPVYLTSSFNCFDAAIGAGVEEQVSSPLNIIDSHFNSAFQPF